MSKTQAIRRLLTSPLVRFGAGAAPAAMANNAYVDQVNPDISDLGRTRANMIAGIMGGVGAQRGALKRLGAAAKTKGGKVGLGLTGASLAARYGFLLPDKEHGHSAGLGDTFDPGHSPVPEVIQDLQDPAYVEGWKRFLSAPLKNTSKEVALRVYDKVNKDYNTPEAHQRIADDIKRDFVPGAYGHLIKFLGGTPSAKPDASEFGATLAPHIVGGAGGGYLGNLAGHAVGNYVFADDPNKSYEERRRQENRRDWLGFAGGGLGTLGGFGAARLATPHISTAVAGLNSKQAFTHSLRLQQKNMRLLGQGLYKAWNGTKEFGKNVAVNAGVGAGITAGQYGMGLVPATEGTTADDASQAGRLWLLNTALTAPSYRKLLLRNNRGFNNKNVKFDPLTRGALSGLMTAATPSLANGYRAAAPIKEIATVANPLADGRDAFADDVNPDNFSDNVQAGIEEAKAQRPVDGDIEKFTSGVGDKLGIPGVGESGQKSLKDLTSAAALSTGLQAVGGGVGGIAGMTGGNWLADTLLQAGVKHKLFKDRPKLFKMLRTLGGLGGGALGAYAGLKGMDRAAPAIADWYKNKLESTTPPPTQA